MKNNPFLIATIMAPKQTLTATIVPEKVIPAETIETSSVHEPVKAEIIQETTVNSLEKTEEPVVVKTTRKSRKAPTPTVEPITEETETPTQEEKELTGSEE